MRLGEHELSLKGAISSHLAEHCCECRYRGGCRPLFHDTKIVFKHVRQMTREIAEAFQSSQRAASSTDKGTKTGGTQTESMPLATTLMPENFVMAVSTDAAHNQDVSCSSQGTQAAITFSAIGTQCALLCLNSTSSQTEEDFSVLEVNDATACASRKFSVSQDGANIVRKSGLACSCCAHSSNTGSSFSGELSSCLSRQQCNHRTTHLKGCGRKKLCICTVCKKAFGDKRCLKNHMRVHTCKRPHTCNICLKSYTRREHLVIHERLHSGHVVKLALLLMK
ncbi:uncharacterized protein LOC144159197 isoform X2 [Haemaphysalis longicornis]